MNYWWTGNYKAIHPQVCVSHVNYNIFHWIYWISDQIARKRNLILMPSLIREMSISYVDHDSSKTHSTNQWISNLMLHFLMKWISIRKFKPKEHDNSISINTKFGVKKVYIERAHMLQFSFLWPFFGQNVESANGKHSVI